MMFPNIDEIPSCQNNAFADGGNGDGPPDAVQTKAGAGKEKSKRNPHQVKNNADHGGDFCFAKPIESAGRRSFDAHKQLRDS